MVSENQEQKKIEHKPIVWTVAGSDCSGLAGQVADVRAMEALGTHPCMITTAVTAQNNDAVVALTPLSCEQISSQFEALKNTMPAKAIKVGLLPTLDSIKVLKNFLKTYQDKLILDPVMVSTSGKQLVAEDALSGFHELIKYATLVTPNLPELAVLSGENIKDLCDEVSIKQAAKKLLELGAKAVLVKGGHKEVLAQDDRYLHDYFVSGQQSFWLHSEAQQTINTRGTGCILASAIAAALAQDYSLEDSVVIGKMLLNQGLRHGYSLTSETAMQKGPLKPLHWPSEIEDLPLLTSSMIDPEALQFSACDEDKPLGLYPVVDRASWLARLLPLGVTTIQLRIKDLDGEALESEIKEAISLAEKHKARLFINDYWQLAIKHGAYGVHLGQEDLETADLSAIAQAELRLGLSTHCYYEVARAHAIQPSYLACGPVYHTDSKEMPWVPHGIDNLLKWKELLPDYPWVAIGGINLERLPQVVRTGVSGVAMISAITQAKDPEMISGSMIECFEHE